MHRRVALLTDRQAEVLGFIRSSSELMGFPPTIREIRDAMGVRSMNAVSDHLNALERKGCITRGDYKARALVLTALGEAQL